MRAWCLEHFERFSSERGSLCCAPNDPNDNPIERNQSFPPCRTTLRLCSICVVELICINSIRSLVAWGRHFMGHRTDRRMYIRLGAFPNIPPFLSESASSYDKGHFILKRPAVCLIRVFLCESTLCFYFIAPIYATGNIAYR